MTSRKRKKLPRKQTGKSGSKSKTRIKRKGGVKRRKVSRKRTMKRTPRLAIGAKFIEGVGSRIFRPAGRATGTVVLTAVIACSSGDTGQVKGEKEKDSMPPGPVAEDSVGTIRPIPENPAVPALVDIEAHADDFVANFDMDGGGITPPNDFARISIQLASDLDWVSLGVRRFPNAPFPYPNVVYEDGILTLFLPKGDSAHHFRVYPLNEADEVIGEPYEAIVTSEAKMGSAPDAKDFGGVIDILHFYGGDEHHLELGDNELEIEGDFQFIFDGPRLVCKAVFEAPEEGEYLVRCEGGEGVYAFQGSSELVLYAGDFVLEMEEGECVGLYPTSSSPCQVVVSIDQL